MFGYGNPIIFILIGHNYFFMTGFHRFLPSDWMLKLNTESALLTSDILEDNQGRVDNRDSHIDSLQAQRAAQMRR